MFFRGRSFSIGALAPLLVLSVGCSRADFARTNGVSTPVVAEPGQVIVRLAPDAKQGSGADFGAPFAEVKRTVSKELRIVVLGLKPEWTVPRALQYIAEEKPAAILRAQADHKVSRRSSGIVPNDPSFKDQWSMYDTAGIRASEAWEIARAKNAAGSANPGVVVAVVDGGVDVRHVDLAGNIFRFAGEIPGNGRDDDGNGYVDDVNGWNTASQNGAIAADFHGTHVAGIVAARGGNGLGVVGVSWAGEASAKVLPVGIEVATTSKVLEAYGYVLAQKKLWIQTSGKKGANIVATNSSFGVDNARCADGDYPLWDEMFDELGKVGILSAAAAPNLESNVDVEGDVPTGCESRYLIKVTNTNSAGEREYGSGYGKISIDLGAPGTEIYSTIPGNDYDFLTGTSMATPHVAGAIAYLYEAASADFWAQVAQSPGGAALTAKALMLSTVDANSSLRGRSVSSGNLNLFRAATAIANWKAMATPNL